MASLWSVQVFILRAFEGEYARNLEEEKTSGKLRVADVKVGSGFTISNAHAGSKPLA